MEQIRTGSYTPWPNRAESAVRVYKLAMSRMSEAFNEYGLKKVPFEQVVMLPANARNETVILADRTPLELAFGRRDPEARGADSMSPEQLTTTSGEDLDAMTRSRIAMASYQAARQQADLMRDVA